MMDPRKIRAGDVLGLSSLEKRARFSLQEPVRVG